MDKLIIFVFCGFLPFYGYIIHTLLEFNEIILKVYEDHSKKMLEWIKKILEIFFHVLSED